MFRTIKILKYNLIIIIWSLSIFVFTSCNTSPLTWEELKEYNAREYEIKKEDFVVVLPTNEEGGKPIFESFKKYAQERWPDVKTVTDKHYLDNGNPTEQNLLILGTPQGNLAFHGFIENFPLTGNKQALVAQKRHAVYWVRWKYAKLPFKVVFLTGLSPSAILKHYENDQDSHSEYTVYENGRIIYKGDIILKQSAPVFKSEVFNSPELKVIIPSSSTRKKEYTDLNFTGEFVTDKEASYRKSAVVIGTPENNLVLSALLNKLPIKISKDGITGRLPHKNSQLIFYGKGPHSLQNENIRIISACNEENLLKYRGILGHLLLKRFDYVIIDGKNKCILENGTYTQVKNTYNVTAPKSNKEMMYEDIDILINYIKDYNPLLAVNKKVYGIDMIERLNFYRSKITGKETLMEFAAILENALRACKGDHFAFWPIVSDNWYFVDITDGSLNYSKKHKSKYNVRVYGKCDQNISAFYFRYNFSRGVRYLKDMVSNAFIGKPEGPVLTYWNGHYYTTYPFSIEGKKYEKGLKLLKVNGQTPEELQKSYQDKLCNWDSKNKCFYSTYSDGDNIFMVLVNDGAEKLDFEFVDKHGEKIEFVYNLKDSVVNQIINMPKPDPQVTYFKKYGILYIRQPRMKNERFYIDSLKKIGPLDGVKAVIWDIRNNHGGVDSAWLNILKMLIEKEVKYNLSYAFRPGVHGGISPQPISIQFLDNEKYCVSNQSLTIVPSKDSLKLKVPIYVLTEKVFSAAGKLFYFAEGIEQLITIGMRNTYPCGSWGRPLRYYLPNSKFIVRDKNNLNFNNCKTADDVLHSIPEIELNVTIDEILQYRNTQPSASLEERLFKEDPYVKKTYEYILKTQQRK